MGRHWQQRRSGGGPARGPVPVVIEQADTVYEGQDPDYVLGVNARSEGGVPWQSVNRLWQVGTPDVLKETSELVDMESETTWQFEGQYPGGYLYYATMAIPGQALITANLAEPPGGG